MLYYSNRITSFYKMRKRELKENNITHSTNHDSIVVFFFATDFIKYL